MLYPTIMTLGVYLAVMICEKTGQRPNDLPAESIARLAINTSVLINMAGIGLVPIGLLWTLFPPRQELLIGTEYILPMRILYLVTGVMAFVLLWFDPFGIVSRYQV